MKSKGHHLQTRHPPIGKCLIAYAVEETSQHPKNTATPGSEVEERDSRNQEAHGNRHCD